MATWMQHAIVIGLAIACATVLIWRRVRALSGKGPACDACAKGCDTETAKANGPIPPHTLVRRRRA